MPPTPHPPPRVAAQPPSPGRCLLPALLVLLGGCAAPPLAPPAPTPVVPAQFSTPASPAAATPAATALPAAGRWWQVFQDPALDALIDRAEQGSPRLAEAAARLAQARALLQAAGAQGRPQLQLSSGASRQGGPLVNAAGNSGTLLTLGASASWEADLWGRGALTEAAARHDSQAQAARLAGARLALQAELVHTVLALRALQADSATVQAGLALQAQALQLDERRVQAGLWAPQQLAQAQASLAAAQAQALGAERQRAELQHALAVLLGEPAGAVRLDTHASATPATPLPTIPPGLPASVLARRPDVAAAEQALQAQRQRAGLARLAGLPTLQLSASGGHAAPLLLDLLQPASRAWSLGSQLLAPLLDGGRREAAQAQADAELAASAAVHQQVLLQALREVDDQLSALATLAAQHSLQQQAWQHSERAAALADSQVRSGLAAPQAALAAHQHRLQQWRQLQQLQAQQQQASVGLIRALGGGWDSPAHPAGAAAYTASAGPL